MPTINPTLSVTKFRLERRPSGNTIVLLAGRGIKETPVSLSQDQFKQIVDTLFPEAPPGLSRWDIGNYEDVAAVYRGEMSEYKHADFQEVK